MERGLTLGSECVMQYADNVLLSCIHEICTVLLTKFIPINPIKNKTKKTESERVVALGLKEGEMGSCYSRLLFQLHKMNKF